MKLRSALLSAVGLSILLMSGSAFAQTVKSRTATSDDAAKAKLGEPAPQFSLTGADGKTYKLSDYEGKIVVLQWINPDCPVCRRVSSSGLVNAMLKDLKEMDPTIVYLTINSTNYMEAEKSAAYLKSNKIEAPALIDQDGKVGHLYGARTTPHVYVIDAEGVLRYQGAFDDDQRGNKDDRTNYAVNTVRMIKAGETVAPDQTRPYGCSVKYKK